MEKKENPHEGHRERMREEFLAHGFDEFTPSHRVLELLLFYCVPRSDTNPLAHELINKYGSLSGVLDAPIEELVEFKGLSRKGAALLKFIIPISRIYAIEKQDKPTGFSSLDEVGEFLIGKFFGFRKENFAVLSLDTLGNLIFFDFVLEGDFTSVGIPMREIVSRCLEKEVPCIMLAHNHPNGLLLPSLADIRATIEIKNTLEKIGIKVLDHIIVNDSDYISMRLSRESYHIFEND